MGAVPSTSIHVVNVGRLHSEARNPNIDGNQISPAVSERERSTRWEEAIEIVNRNLLTL
jgi:hypothetical protein